MFTDPVRREHQESKEYPTLTLAALAFGFGEFCATCFAFHIDAFDRKCYATDSWIEAQILELDEEDDKAEKYFCSFCSKSTTTIAQKHGATKTKAIKEHVKTHSAYLNVISGLAKFDERLESIRAAAPKLKRDDIGKLFYAKP